MNISTTFDHTPFADINCPKYNGWGIDNIKVPNGEGIFHKTFYMLYEGKIMAFKILAWAFGGRERYNQPIAYLIQTPTFTKWHYFNTKFFTSVNDLVEGTNPFEIPKVTTCTLFHNAPSECHIKIEHNTYNIEVMQSFLYSKSASKVVQYNTQITYIMGVENGVFIGLTQRGDCKNTKEETIATQFNGIEIVDFAEPVVVDIRIEIPRTEVVTKRLVLK